MTTLLTLSDVDRFWRFVPERPADGCWPWYGSNSFTYGPRKRRRYVKPRRIAWLLSRGKRPPTGMWIVPECGNDRCVRPDHLVARHRSEHSLLTACHAETQKRAMTDAQVAAAKLLVGRGLCTQREIAKRLGVSQATVSRSLNTY